MRVFVGNLAYGTTEEELRGFLFDHGFPADVKILVDRETGQSRGFGFAEVDNPDVLQLNGQQLHGRALVINEARPREERPNRRAARGSR